MKRCEYCDNPLKDGGKFCSRCGERVPGESDGPGEARPGGAAAKTREYKSDKARPFLSEPARFIALVRVGEEDRPAMEALLKPGPFVIGRSQGDWVFPDDALMSSRHATIETSVSEAAPRERGGESPWRVKLLDQSKNGTFVRAKEAVKVTDGLCCLLGGYLLEWTACQPAAAAGGRPGHTVELKRGRAAPVFELSVSGPEGTQTIPVGGPATIGSKAAEVLLKDPHVSEFHAELARRDDGYYLEDRGGRNGIFVPAGKEAVALAEGDELRMGGQVFRLEGRVF